MICHACTGFGRKEVVEFLLENGAKVDSQDDGEYVVRECLLVSNDYGLSYYYFEILRQIYGYHLDWGKMTPVALSLTCASIHPHCTLSPTGGLIPLHNACSFGHADVVSLLLKNGADPNSRDNWNFTPLHEAAIKGKVDVCISESGMCG